MALDGFAHAKINIALRVSVMIRKGARMSDVETVSTRERGAVYLDIVKDGQTILIGEIIDQPHLFGILDRINGLGLELLSVQALPEDAHPSAEGIRDPEESEL